MKKEIKLFENPELSLQVRTILNPDGSISVNAEDTAIGFGWVQKQYKEGKDYTSIRWERMNNFSAECGFPHLWGKDDYIPESLFYRLGMKASNAVADKLRISVRIGLNLPFMGRSRKMIGEIKKGWIWGL